MDGHGAINDTARALFAPLGSDYDRWAAILSFAQDPRWRRFLVEHVPVGPDATVLDVATGTGAIARALVRRYGCRVVGVDQSPQMLDGARERIGDAGGSASSCGSAAPRSSTSRRAPSTPSRRATCCATWTTPCRRCATCCG